MNRHHREGRRDDNIQVILIALMDRMPYPLDCFRPADPVNVEGKVYKHIRYRQIVPINRIKSSFHR